MEIIDYIEKTSKELGLLERREKETISLWTSPLLGISIHISCDENENLSFYYHQRTNSWSYNGDRTDLHDIIPIMFAVFIRKIGLCSLFFTDVYNPATLADCEIYSKYLVPFQINNNLANKNSEKYQQYVTMLVYSLFIFEHNFWTSFPGCPCNDCRKRLGYKFEYTFDIPKQKLNHIITSLNGNENNTNYCERTLPNWFYLRDFTKRISVIESQELLVFINDLKYEEIKTVDAINGKLFVENDFNNYLSNTKKKEIQKIIIKLDDKIQKIILLENRVIVTGDKYILSFNYECGINKFQVEKDKVKLRHDKEFRILFKPSKLQWSEKIEDSRFEDLIKDLLEREPNVLRVRKMSHTRERDGGVDLVVDWSIPRETMSLNENSPYRSLKIIVQCKAYKGGVSKSQVTDIRDTIEHKNYDGYFLAVSSYIKKSLSDHLDKMRVDSKFWVDWWSKDEIEKRLISHKDLIMKYDDIFTSKY